MELLLDECIDRRLGRELLGHTVQHATQKGWASFQQNLAKYNIALLVLRAKTNKLEDLRPLVPKILIELSKIKPKQVVTIGI